MVREVAGKTVSDFNPLLRYVQVYACFYWLPQQCQISSMEKTLVEMDSPFELTTNW